MYFKLSCRSLDEKALSELNYIQSDMIRAHKIGLRGTPEGADVDYIRELNLIFKIQFFRHYT